MNVLCYFFIAVLNDTIEYEMLYAPDENNIDNVLWFCVVFFTKNNCQHFLIQVYFKIFIWACSRNVNRIYIIIYIKKYGVALTQFSLNFILSQIIFKASHSYFIFTTFLLARFLTCLSEWNFVVDFKLTSWWARDLKFGP